MKTTTSGERKNRDSVLILAAPEEPRLQTATKTREERETSKPNDQARCGDLEDSKGSYKFSSGSRQGF